MTYGTRQLLLHDGCTHGGISEVVAIPIALRIVCFLCFLFLLVSGGLQSHGSMDVVNRRV